MTLLRILVSTNLIMTPVILLLLFLTPVLEKKFTAIGRCWMWLMVMAGLCVPFVSLAPQLDMGVLATNMFLFKIDLPIAALYEQQSAFSSTYITELKADDDKEEVVKITPDKNVESTMEITQSDGKAAVGDEEDLMGARDTWGEAAQNADLFFEQESNRRAELPKWSRVEIVLIVWIVGVLISLAYHISLYLWVRRFIRRWSEAVDDNSIITAFFEEQARMGVCANIKLLRCRGLASPMLIGLVRPAILLPNYYFDSEEIIYIFRHELIHYKRRDLWYKLALAVVKSIYWFNPFVWIMAAQANRDIEIVCDTLTTVGLDISTRKRYSEIILSMAAGPHLCRSQLTTYFIGGKNMLKSRFSNILGSAKKNGAVMFVMLGAVVLAASTMVGFDFAPEVPAIFQENEDEASFNQKESTDLYAFIDVEDIITSITDVFTDNYKNYSLDELYGMVFDEVRMTEREFDSIVGLKINTAGDKVKISHGGDKLAIRYYEWFDDQYLLDVSSGTLTLNYQIPTYRTGNNWSDSWLWSLLKSRNQELYYTVEIIVPDLAGLELISIDTASGGVEIKDFAFEGSLNIDTASGEVDIEGCKFGGDERREIDTASGAVNIKDCEIDGRMEIDTASGAVTVNGGEIIGDMRIDTASGAVEVNNYTAFGLDIDSASGRVDIWDCVITGGKLKTHNTSGQSEIKGCTAERIDASLVNGTISLEECAFERIDISMVNGTGNIMLSDSAENYDISFSAVNGRLMYNGERTKDMRADSDRTINLSCVNGVFNIRD